MSKNNQNGFDPVKSFLQTRPNYEIKPWLSLGATDSAHQVFFAANGNGTVAVKAYNGDRAQVRAEHEERMLHIIRDLGFLTLTPLGIETNTDTSTAFLLTRYIPDLRSMSSIVQDKRGDVRKQVQRTAATLGELHAKGTSHGDSQIKNFIVVPSEKKRILIPDPEKGGTEQIGHYKSNPYQHDLDSLVQSLAYKSYGGRNPDFAGDRIIEDVIEPYILAVDRVGSKHLAAHEVGQKALDQFLIKHDDLYGPK